MTETILIVKDTVQGLRIADFPDLGTVTDGARFLGELAGSGLFAATALRTYVNTGMATAASVTSEATTRASADTSEANARIAADATFRRPLTANTTWYVSSSGSDSSAGTSGAPWLTLQYAVDTIKKTYDGRGFTGTISVADGSYNLGSGLVIDGEFTGFSLFTISCSATLNSVVLSSTGHTILAQNQAQVTISGGFLLGCGGGYTCVSSNLGAQVHIGGLTIAPSVAGSLLYTSRGGYLEVDTDIHVATGTSGNLVQASHGGNFRHSNGSLFVFDGNHVFSDAVLYCLFADLTITDSAGFNLSGHTVIGQRYRVAQNGMLQWALGTQTSIPGDTSGVEEEGGRYSFGNWPVEHAAGSFDYDLSIATGAVTNQASGFMPGSIDVWASVAAVTTGTGSTGMCVIGYTGAAPVILANYCTAGGTEGPSPNNGACLQFYTGAGAGVTAAVSAVLNNGFSLTFTKAGAPTGTMKVFWRARRGL